MAHSDSAARDIGPNATGSAADAGSADEAGNGWRRQIRRLADPRVICWPLFWFSYAWFIIDALPDYLRADSGPSISIATLMLATTVSQLVTFAFLVLAKYTYLRPAIARRHPSWTVLSFALASLLGAIASRMVELSLQPELVDAPEPDLFNHTVYQTIALSIMGVLVVALREHQSDVAHLTAAQEGLVATRAAGQQTLVTEREQVEQRVTALANELNATLPRIGPADASAVLGYAAAEVIRPLSHELALAAPTTSRRSVVEVPYPSWVATMRSIAAGSPLIKPAWMGLTVVLLAARLTVTGASPQSLPPDGQGVQLSVDFTGLFKAVAQLLIVFTAVWLSARAAAWLLRRYRWSSGSSSWPATIAATLGIAVSAQLLIAAAFVLAGFELPQASPAGVVLFAVPLFLVVLVVAVVRTVAARRSAAVAELSRVNEDLEWEMRRTNELLWRQRRSLSTWLHGPLQATLNASAIQLAQERAGKSDIDAALRSFARASALPPGGLPGKDIVGELSAVRQTWKPICEINWSLDPGTAALIASDPVCSSTLSSVIVEGCSNSVIHGGASAIDITLEADEKRCVRLIVADNGTPTNDAIDGLGTQMLNDVCLSWERTYGPRGTVVVARFPVDSS